MRKFYVALSFALITVLTSPEFTRPGMALTSAEAVDQANAYPSVGSLMVWRDPNNPLGLPGGLAGQVTAVLIHSQTLLTAGHFAARAEVGDSAIRSSRRQLRTERTRPVHLDRRQSRPRHVHRSSFVSETLHPAELPVRRHRRAVRAGDQRCRPLFLDEPVLGIRPARLANRSLDDARVTGTRMTIVGYGTTAPAPGGPADTSLYDGIRRWGTSTVDQVIDQNWVTFNRDPVGVCYGDSGAPTFFNGRVVAVASDGALDCVSADNRRTCGQQGRAQLDQVAD